jgi:hypothetical protein
MIVPDNSNHLTPVLDRHLGHWKNITEADRAEGNEPQKHAMSVSMDGDLLVEELSPEPSVSGIIVDMTASLRSIRSTF